MTNMTAEEQALKTKMDKAYADSFMKPEILEVGSVVSIDGFNGIVSIDSQDINASLNGLEMGTSLDIDYLEPDLRDAVEEAYYCQADSKLVFDIIIQEGFLYRLSASGYMDSTDFIFASTRAEAMQELIDSAE